MSVFDKLERRLGFLAVRNLTQYIVVGQIAVFVMALLRGDFVGEFLGYVAYRFDDFGDGKPWTVISFLFVPRHLGFDGWGMFWNAISWLMLFSLGSQLEREWGVFRFNAFIFLSLVGIFVTSVIFPHQYMTNYYLLSSIWFAFFITYPDIPFFFGIKAKWLGIFFAAMTALEFFGSSALGRMLIAGSLINIPVFFAGGLVQRFRSKQRVREMQEAKRKFEEEPFHVCQVCGATDKSHPERDFRYRESGAICSVCAEKEVETENTETRV